MHKFVYLMLATLATLAIIESGRSNPEQSIEPKPTSSYVPRAKLSSGKFCVAAIPHTYQVTEKNMLAVFNKATESGAQVLSAGYGQWPELEPSAGDFKWADHDKIFGWMDKHKFTFEVSFDIGGPFFHNDLQIPGDIKFKQFDHPILVQRYKNLITSMLHRYGSKVDYISIHSEGSYTQFGEHPERFDSYLRFLTQVKNHIQAYDPDIRVGINTEMLNSDKLMQQYYDVLDYVAFMTSPDKPFDTPQKMIAGLKQQASLAGSKKIAVQDAGWSTSGPTGISLVDHAQFFRDLIGLLAEESDRIDYMCMTPLFDEDKKITRAYVNAMFLDPVYNQETRNKMIEAFASAGLHYADQRPKPAWEALKESVRTYYKATNIDGAGSIDLNSLQ